MIDDVMWRQVEENPNRSIPYYLMASYGYYIEDSPFLTDHCYDKLARYIHDNWDSIQHPHKQHLTQSDLRAGTFLGEYPTIVKGAVADIRSRYAGIGVYT